MHPYRWHILIAIGALLAVTFVFFGLASKRQDKVSITKSDTKITQITTPTISFVDPQIGSANPVVTIVEYADFTCEACKSASTALAQLLSKYPNDVRVVWKDFPNESKDDQATVASVAARCADEQGAFWQYHDELFLRQAQLDASAYAIIASALELNTTSFTSCMTTNEPLPRVRKAYEEGLALSITATPTLFINGERYIGAISFDDLEGIVRNAKANLK